ncbi:tubulin monoglycylase TTLL3-like isoform X3 [Trachinotus anak]|uniref:tubulin monoglycylase TTLL3-like isoform X3 n=1 Tax=Trachinotus anak TaxID=443729 RepID=UPI0039F1EB79
MEATGSRQSFQLGRKGHHITGGYCIPCPGSAGETGGRSKNQKVTAVTVFKQCNQDEAKSLQTSAIPESKVRHNLVSLPHLNPAKVSAAKALVEKAVKMHKVFSIQGPYPVIREALRARGWVEQRMHNPNRHPHQCHSSDSRASSNDTDDSDNDDNYVKKEQDPDELYDLMSRLVRNEMVYFFWTNRRDAINANSLHKAQITNHFAKAGSFTTKVGLCMNLRNLHWFDSADPDTFFPRCYRLGVQDEKHAFIGQIPSLKQFLLYFWRCLALCLCPLCRRLQENCLHQFFKVHCGEGAGYSGRGNELQPLACSSDGAEIENGDRFVKCCEAMLQRLGEVRPQLDIDGIQNIWIIKPGAMSRGRGIKCYKRLDEILRLVNVDQTLIKESKWVVQKYLERPLLIHGTKFDMRQWFLVTDWNPLTVWFYKKCYLRFSTQPYSLNILDSSVHLCNNSIQKHLRPSQRRHRDIPADNMWSDEQFRTFLSRQGREAQWHAVVVPGMKEAIIHALRTSQDLMESRKNTFELYGADFMLGRDLHPWLIEINASPTMAHSSRVTARLCTAVQRDTLRVILDRSADCTANTGDFQLIYRQAPVKVPQYVGLNLLVEGFKIKSPFPLPPLRPSAPKHHGPAEEKKPAEEKVKPLPKMLLNSTETQLGNTSSGVQPPPPRPPEPPLPVPIEPVTLHLPMTVNKSIHLPVSAQSHSVFLCKRRSEISKACSDKVQPSTTERHQSPSFPLEITLSKQSRPAATSTLSA